MVDNRLAFAEQEESEEFVRRHIGPGPEDREVMLEALGYESIDALVEAAVPAKIRVEEPLDLPPALPDHDQRSDGPGNRECLPAR